MAPKTNPNAGRKTIDKEALTETISIRLTKSELEEITKISENINLPKTRFMRNLLIMGLDDAKTLNKIGALKGARKLLDFKERFLNPSKYKELSLE